jgi:hypothetical protein
MSADANITADKITYTYFPVWRIDATWSRTFSEKYREIGARFWEERPRTVRKDSYDWNKLFSLDGKDIEVHAVSHEYPEILVGRAEDSGVVNLTGITKARQLVEQCSQASQPAS